MISTRKIRGNCLSYRGWGGTMKSGQVRKHSIILLPVAALLLAGCTHRRPEPRPVVPILPSTSMSQIKFPVQQAKGSGARQITSWELREATGLEAWIAGVQLAPMTTLVVRNHAIATLAKEQHLLVLIIRAEGPAVREHNWLSLAPVLVIDFCSVFRRDCRHGNPRLVRNSIRAARLQISECLRQLPDFGGRIPALTIHILNLTIVAITLTI